MGKYAEMIGDMKKASYQEKLQFFEFFVKLAQKNRRELDEDDKNALRGQIAELADTLPRLIQDSANYREKDLFFGCTDYMLQLVMALYPSAGDVEPTLLQKLTGLSEMVTRQRTIEATLDSIMENATVSSQDITRLLYWVRQTPDEYQRGRLLVGLIHYSQQLDKLSAEARQSLGDFLSSEFQRWLSSENPDQDVLSNLELIADVAKHFPTDSMVECLYQVLLRPHNHIRYFALETLLQLERTVSDEVIQALACDIVYANNTYNLLLRAGVPHRFPEEYCSEAYLAKSDLVHWLTYPTELNQVPDEIEYMGKVKFLLRRDAYHIFKYRSASSNLSEDSRNQWLIGWSSRNGGTFSNFDKLEDYQMETPEKTLKNIKRKLIK